MPRSCESQVLARSNVGQVELCSCGSVHLGVGPLSLRIDPVAFLCVVDMLVEARSSLGRGVTQAGSPVAFGAPIDAD